MNGKMKKKILAFMVMLSVVFTIISTNSLAVSEEVITKEGIFSFNLATNMLVRCEQSATGEITIPSSVQGVPITAIDASAFSACSGVTNVIIPDGIKFIGMYAFKDCTGLTNITIPDSVTNIANFSFRDCVALKSVKIGKSVTGIGSYAFADCINLTSINIPASVSSIGHCFINKSNNITTINVDGANTAYTSIDGVLFSKDKTTLVAYPNGKGSNYSIPGSVTTIENHSFMDCVNLKNITIPNSVKTIKVGAFENCTGLTDVYYNGTESEWNIIDIKSDNNSLRNATIHFNSKPIQSGSITVSFNDSELPQAEYGTGYNIKFQMQDGTAPEKVEFTSITPAGLTVNADGTITGTPKVVGNYPSLPVKCTDSSGNTIIKEFDLQVMPQEVHVELDGDAAIEYDGETHTLPLKCVEVPDLELSALYGVGKTAAPSEAGSYYAQVFSNNPLYRIARDKDYYLTIEKKNIEIAHTPQTYQYDGKPHAYEFVAERGYAPVVKYKPYTASDDLNRPSNDSGYTETPPIEKGKYRVWISAADKNHHIYDGPSTVSMSPYVFGVLEITD